MTADLDTHSPSPPVLTDRTLIRIGAASALAAGALRLPSSFIDSDASGADIEALYFAIDVAMLFAAITAFVAIPSSRTRLGTLGFAITAIGTGLLIGPEPTDTDVEYYAIGATAVTIGFALLAIGWRQSPRVTPATRIALLGTVAIGVASGLHHVIFITAGITFSLALLSLGRDLHRIAQLRIAPRPAGEAALGSPPQQSPPGPTAKWSGRRQLR